MPREEAVVDSASASVIITALNDHDRKAREEAVVDTYQLLLLRFFRDISPAQRVGILASLGALPPNWQGTLSETFERKALDGLVKAGRSNELWIELRKIVRE